LSDKKVPRLEKINPFRGITVDNKQWAVSNEQWSIY
jgi:hypothetical protein